MAAAMVHILCAGLLFLAAMASPPNPPVIIIDPSPPKQGDEVTIEYTGRPGTVLNLDWDPSATPGSVTIGQDGKATVTVPDDATSLTVTDPTPNGAVAQVTSVTPT